MKQHSQRIATLPQDRAMATGNMHRKFVTFGRVFLIYRPTCR